MRPLSAIPYLLVASTLPEHDELEIHSFSSLLPQSRSNAEEIIEQIAIFELTRSVIKGNHSQLDALAKLKIMFDFDDKKVTSYSSVFAHCAVCIEIGAHDSLDSIVSAMNSTSSVIKKAASRAITILNTFQFEPAKQYAKNDEDTNLTVKFLSLLSTIGSTSNYVPQDSDSKKYLEMIKTINGFVNDDLTKNCQQKIFADVNMICDLSLIHI